MVGVIGKSWEHQPGKLRTGHTPHRFIHVDDPLIDELDSNSEGCRSGPLAHARLQHPQSSPFHRELDVAQVLIVQFQAPHDVEEFVVGLGITLAECRERKCVANARHHILTLGVREVVAVDTGGSRAGIAGECHSGPRPLAQIAECHDLHIDCGAEIVRDTLSAAIEPGPIGVPRPKHGTNSQV